MADIDVTIGKTTSSPESTKIALGRPTMTFEFSYPGDNTRTIRVDCLFSSLEAAERAFKVLHESQSIMTNPLTDQEEKVKVWVADEEVPTDQLSQGYARFAAPYLETTED